jgi:hypothetical protein
MIWCNAVSYIVIQHVEEVATHSPKREAVGIATPCDKWRRWPSPVKKESWTG